MRTYSPTPRGDVREKRKYTYDNPEKNAKKERIYESVEELKQKDSKQSNDIANVVDNEDNSYTIKYKNTCAEIYYNEDVAEYYGKNILGKNEEIFLGTDLEESVNCCCDMIDEYNNSIITDDSDLNDSCESADAAVQHKKEKLYKRYINKKKEQYKKVISKLDFLDYMVYVIVGIVIIIFLIMKIL